MPCTRKDIWIEGGGGRVSVVIGVGVGVEVGERGFSYTFCHGFFLRRLGRRGWERMDENLNDF